MITWTDQKSTLDLWSKITMKIVAVENKKKGVVVLLNQVQRLTNTLLKVVLHTLEFL